MIFLNKMDITQIEPDSIYSRISVVSQESYLFSRTLAENIGFSETEEIEKGKIEIAAQKAGLAKDVDAFPDQYSQMIGERGITLSGGQKQRTSIARALYKQAEMLVLDDALSSVDSQTEEEILQNLYSLRGQNTLVVVSHRISALKGADMIYVLDEGKIVEQGDHDFLMQQQGFYARLAEIQTLEEE